MRSVGTLCAVLCVTAGWAGAVQATLPCATLPALSADLTAPEFGQAVCTATACTWTFDFRAPAATEAFDRLAATLETCLGPEAKVTSDPSVNHPDFYALRLYTTAAGQHAVSLKDKSAQGATYVFLRQSAPEQ